MTDVFISYSRKDEDFVRRLYNALSEKDRQAWVDWEGIPLTADWWAEIRKGIEAADSFLFIISPDSVTSPVCNREIEHAVTHNKRLVPIVRRETVPEQMNKALSRHNWLYARDNDDFNDVFNRLIDALNTDLDYVKGHTRLLVRARDWEDNEADSSYLLRGSELQEAESWLAQSGGKEPKPTELQTKFILASRRSSNTRQRTLLAGVSVALAITIILALISAVLFSRAEASRQESDTRGTAVAQQAGTATNALGLSESRGTEVALGAATAIAAEATSARRSVEWQGLAWAIASERAAAAEDHDASLTLALQAMTIPDPPSEVRAQLLDAAYAPGTARLFAGGHQGWIAALDVSPDGRYLLSSGLEGVLALWDTATGEVIQSEAFGQGTDLGGGAFMNMSANSAVAFHPALPNIAVIGANSGSLAVIDVEAWQVLASINTGALVETLVYSPDGSRLAVGLASSQNNIQIYNASTLDLLSVLSGHRDDVTSLAFSPDSALLLSGADDAAARLWDVASGESLTSYGPIVDEIEPDVDLIGVAFGADIEEGDPTVILATNSGQIIILDRASGAELFRCDVGVTTSTVAEIAISPDRRTLVSAAYDGIASLWDTRSGRRLRTLRTGIKPLSGAVFSRDGLSLYTASQDSTLRRWFIRSGAEVARFSGFDNGAGAVSLAFSPDGSRALVGGGTSDPAVLVWNLETGVLERRLEGHPDAVLAIDTRISEEGHLIALTSGWDSHIRLWDVDTGEQLQTYDLGGIFVSSLHFSRDGTQALLTLYSSRLQIPTQAGVLDLTTGDMVQRYDTGFELYLASEVSPDGASILIGGANLDGTGRAALVDAQSGDAYFTLEDISASAVQSFAFNAGASRALVGTQDGQIIELSLPDGRELRRYTGHTDVVSSVEYSPDQRQVISASFDDTFRIWDAQTGAQILSLAADDDGRVVTYAPDGALYTASRDGGLSRWSLDLDSASVLRWIQDNRFVRDLTCAERLANRIPPLCEGDYPADS